MKLNYFQIETHLAKELHRIYLISGEDILLKQDACRLIRKTALKNAFTERMKCVPESANDWDELHLHLNSTSLFSTKRFIEVDASNSKITKSAAQSLVDYASQPDNDTILVIDIGKADPKLTKTAWFQALEKKGILIQCWPISRNELPKWLMERAQKYKLNLSLSAANTLADLVEGNLLAASQALEKLYLLRSDTAIDTDQILGLFENNSQFSIFELVDALIAKNKKQTLERLAALQEEGVEPILILWAVTRELRTLISISTAVQNGQSIDSELQKQRVFTKKQPMYKRFLQTTPTDAYAAFIQHAARIDEAIKGAVAVNSWESLALLCTRIAM